MPRKMASRSASHQYARRKIVLLGLLVNFFTSFQGWMGSQSSVLVEAFVARSPKALISTVPNRQRLGTLQEFHVPATPGQKLTVQRRGRSALAMSPLVAITDPDDVRALAEALGYLVGASSLVLYTPIIVRILRQKSADGLTVSTWWLKLTAYTCTDVYNLFRGFPLSAFFEILVITVEAAIILSLVSFYQRKISANTVGLVAVYAAMTTWALASPPGASWAPTEETYAFAQVVGTLLNASALLPQIVQNARRSSAGDYSAVTACLATGCCLIRLFTTMQLTGGDPLILANYGLAFLLNITLLFQILWHGTRDEGQSVKSLFLADVQGASK